MNYFLYQLTEVDYKEITWWAMTIRGLFFFILGIILIKIGGKRMFGREGAYDIVISIMLGALLAKGIAGNARVIPTIITCIAMALFHNLLSRLSFYNRLMEKFIKGDKVLLIENGKMKPETMKKHNVTYEDIVEVMRNKNHSTKSDEIEEAYIEANGKISVILRENKT